MLRRAVQHATVATQFATGRSAHRITSCILPLRMQSMLFSSTPSESPAITEDSIPTSRAEVVNGIETVAFRTPYDTTHMSRVYGPSEAIRITKAFTYAALDESVDVGFVTLL